MNFYYDPILGLQVTVRRNGFIINIDDIPYENQSEFDKILYSLHEYGAESPYYINNPRGITPLNKITEEFLKAPVR